MTQNTTYSTEQMPGQCSMVGTDYNYCLQDRLDARLQVSHENAILQVCSILASILLTTLAVGIIAMSIMPFSR